MKVGYAILYEDGTLTISKEHTILQQPIYKDYGEFDDYNRPWRNDTDKIKIVKILNRVKSNCMKEWFVGCKNLTTLIDFQNLDVSDCKVFGFMFSECKSLTNISALTNWDVSNGRDFSGMFFGCKSLINISVLSNWNMSNGEDFGIFGKCFNLKEIYLPNTLNSLTQDMFEYCDPNLKIQWKDTVYTYGDLMEYQEF